MTDAWIETFTGLKFDVLNPQPEMIEIADIAHALSQLCRFVGHTRHLYSVGEHSLYGSYLVPKKDALHFLLHDASESYLGDLSRPLKHFTEAGKAYRELETKISNAIYLRFGLNPIEPESVKIADNQMLYAEKEQLMGKAQWTHDWGSTNAAPIKIFKHDPEEVEKEFLNRFYELSGEVDTSAFIF